ncbi:MAG TPA: DUF364 domain-containing protein [Caproiciproducens sp.]|nr:DUF364 domain-containing protein [Caproiciproducens sp.]
MWELYDSLIEGVTSDETVEEVITGDTWTYVETSDRCGIAMTTRAESRPPRIPPSEYRGLSLQEAAKLVKSWNFTEAGVGMAAINAFYNTSARLKELDALQPDHQFCTAGMEVKGKRIGMVGHLRMTDHPLAEAEEIRIVERNPQEGDYPDSACEYLFPDCDIVIITGSAFTNKTMPRLLQICKNSKVVVTGPSVPMAPNLLRFGITRLAGLVITNTGGVKGFAQTGIHGPPYDYGDRFCID